MAKIAIAVAEALTARRQHGAPAGIAGQRLASGDGWAVTDVVCTAGPHDRPYEERQTSMTISMVVAGSFQYRSALGRELMTPGSLMLGRVGHCFECGHEHGAGDRCISFAYDPVYFERLAADAGVTRRTFTALRVPPVREIARFVAAASAGVIGSAAVPWEELGVGLAVRTLQLLDGVSSDTRFASPDAIARVTRAVRSIEHASDRTHTLGSLARRAGLSVYHFLRIFEQLTGVTPHQYVLRARLRDAAARLVSSDARVLDVALDCGFGDVSNFNRAFRGEFGVSPRAYRRLHDRTGGQEIRRENDLLLS